MKYKLYLEVDTADMDSALNLCTQLRAYFKRAVTVGRDFNNDKIGPELAVSLANAVSNAQAIIVDFRAKKEGK